MPSTTSLAALANPEAERALLGALLLDPACLLETAAVLSGPAAFHGERHATIYQAMQQRAAATLEGGFDIVTLADALERQGCLQAIGGFAYLIELVTTTPTAAHADHYAATIEDLAARRRALAELNRAAGLLYDTSQPLAEVENALQRATTALSTPQAAADDTLLWELTFDTWAEWQLERAADNERKAPKLDLPWRAFSPYGVLPVRPLRRGSLAIVGAEPGIGKTAFVECCAEHWARRGFQVAFYHYELDHQTMLDRRMARWSGETMETIENGALTERMQDADTVMHAWPGRIHYVYCGGWPMVRLIARAQQMTARRLADVVIVDYLQKAPLHEYTRGMNPAQMAGWDVELLKQFSERANGAPVLALSQFNVAGGRETRRVARNLLGTGDIERKASVVITLDRPILEQDQVFGTVTFQAGKRSPITVARVDKQNHGDTGDAKLVFNGKRFMFADLVKEEVR